MIKVLKLITKNCLGNFFHIRKKPKVIQMPITSRCNSRCKTCNIWKLRDNIDMDVSALSVALKDPFFSEVESVGINGGEITLFKEFNTLIDVILSIDKIKYIHIISNGLLPDRLIERLSITKRKCESKKVKLAFTLSVDGIYGVHDTIRGVSRGFSKTLHLLNVLLEKKEQLCDSFDIGCTISRYNVPFLIEFDEFIQEYGFPVIYHLGVPNKRIYTFNNSEDYNVLKDERSRLLAVDFFKMKMKTDCGILTKIRYFINYYYLKNKGEGRLAICSYLYQDVTIDEKLNLSLCATASDAIGNLKEYAASQIVKRGALGKEEKKVCNRCNTCIHYAIFPTFKGCLYYVVDNLWEKYSWGNKYKLLNRWFV